MQTLITLGLFLPLIGFLILLFSSDIIGRRLAGIIGCTSIALSFICFTSLFLMSAQPEVSVTLYQWIPFARINADFKLVADHISLLMTLIITGVGLLIHVYSVGYMDHEEDYARFFACMNFFVFAMLLLVLAGNLLLLFVGWEGVGLASYLLIGFWYQRPAAAQAATKAFVVNRIGDLGFLLGVLLTLYLFGTTDIQEVLQRAGQEYPVGSSMMVILTLLLFIGAIGKSAQIPLHVWLPDAMEGPTPVSALIHAATMVTAGVYLVVRLHPVYLLAPQTMQIIGYIGGATALFAALCALGQTDLKRVLAYSTVSQLGFMFLACGVGAFYAAMFHLTTHAFVKALLFLSAGNVVHMMHGVTDMNKMGGLSKIFPKTHYLFLIGVLAMSGLPPFAAFFSKDLILEDEHRAGFQFLYYIALTTSILTAFYLTRAYCLTFTGKTLSEEKMVKEAPSVMLAPVSILAFLSVVGGLLGFALGKRSYLEDFLDDDPTMFLRGHEVGFHLSWNLLLPIGCAILGIASAAVIYLNYRERIGKTIALFNQSFYIDQIYEALIVTPLKMISQGIAAILEPKLFDGMIEGLSSGTQRIASWMQILQSGQIRSYIAWMTMGAVLLIGYFIL